MAPLSNALLLLLSSCVGRKIKVGEVAGDGCSTNCGLDGHEDGLDAHLKGGGVVVKYGSDCEVPSPKDACACRRGDFEVDEQNETSNAQGMTPPRTHPSPTLL